MNRINKTLKNYGLSDNEIVVYLEALKHEELSPYKLSKLTGVPRTTVYDVMTSLSLKGLIVLIQNEGLEKQQTRIKANNPSVLRDMINKRHQDLHKLETDVVDILPELKGNYFKNTDNADFRFYEGVEGARYVMNSDFEDNVDMPLYVVTHLMPMDLFGTEAINDMVSNDIKNMRLSKYKPKKLIPLTEWTMHVISYQYERDPSYIKDREIRLIDSSLFDIKQRIAIKGDKVRITCAERDEIWGMIINSKEMSRSLRSMFQLLWYTAQPVTEALVKSWGPSEYKKYESL